MARTPLEQESAGEALFRLADWTNCTGDAYFRGLVRGLADVLSVRWVYLSKLHPQKPRHVQVVAGWADGGPATNIEYDLAHTPCAEVLTGAACFYPTGVAGLFPWDRMLVDLGVDAYAGTPLRGADGQAQGLLVIMHDRPLDVSRQNPCTILDLVAGRAAAELERSRVEAQLRQSEEQIRFLSESTPALLWRATTDGRLDYVSPRAAEYCGTSIDALLGHGYVAYMHPDDVTHKLRLWNLARETGQPFEAEYRLRGVDGTYRWQLTRALPQRDATGAIVRWYGSVLDVDDRRRAEEALREADRRKDEFLAMLAHELRNPLAPIRHALAVQARSSDDIEISREMRQTMERQVEHLVRLVDDLLDVSRLTTGQITLRREPVDVRDIVTDAVETCREIVDVRGHCVTTRLPDESLLVEGDRIRLVQVVTNILNNAAKFTELGGQIDIDAGERDGALEIRVRDSGIGISEDRLPRIFDLFFQSDPSPARAHGGLGVGLTLARRLVELHAGVLTASSAGAGCGSEFRIALPRATARVHPVAPQLAASTQAPVESLRVLVVDDYVDATRALERLLRVMGHEVVIAHDGKSGIELAERILPEVILLDIGLPEMDGYSVARHLRSLPSLAATRIIALTGYGAERARQSVREAGFDLHLVKPVDADELEAALCAARN
jgi:two-component system, chemotaxis family, CheB/CheR fusion protein